MTKSATELGHRRWFQFKLSTLFLAVFFLAAYLALRNTVMRSDALNTTIFRALWGSSLFAALGGALAGVIARRQDLRPRQLLLKGAIAGASLATAVVIALAVEIATGFGRAYPNYFQWSRDWTDILTIVFWQGCIDGAIIGGTVAALWLVQQTVLRYSIVSSLVILVGVVWAWLGFEVIRVRQEDAALSKFTNGQAFNFDLDLNPESVLIPSPAVVDYLRSYLSAFVIHTIVKVKVFNESPQTTARTDWSQIQTLKNLRSLELSNTALSDSDLIHLHILEKLELLILDEEAITDQGLWHLQEMESLRAVILTSTKVTENGVTRLKESLPDCYVVITTKNKPSEFARPARIK